MILRPFDTPADGLEAELVLLDAVKAGTAPDSGFIWSSRNRGLVAPEPFRRAPGFGAACEMSASAGWPVTLRKTGGGVTPQGPGVINLALARNFAGKNRPSIKDAYLEICDILVSTLSEFGISAAPGPNEASFCDGDYNLLVGGRKIAGTAQRWRGSAILCHALILTTLDLDEAAGRIRDFCETAGRPIPVRADAHICLSDLVAEDPDKGLDDRISSALLRAAGRSFSMPRA